MKFEYNCGSWVNKPKIPTFTFDIDRPLNIASESRPPRSMSLLRNRWGLNWSASSPQTEASICTRCRGTTNIDRAGTVTPEPRVKSALKENEIQSESKWNLHSRKMKSKVSQNGKHTAIKTGLQVTHGFLLQLDVHSTDQSKSNFKHHEFMISTHTKSGLAKAFKQIPQMSINPLGCLNHQCLQSISLPIKGHPEILWCQHMQQRAQSRGRRLAEQGSKRNRAHRLIAAGETCLGRMRAQSKRSPCKSPTLPGSRGPKPWNRVIPARKLHPFKFKSIC